MDWLIGKQSSETVGYSAAPLPSCALSLPLYTIEICRVWGLLEAAVVCELLFGANAIVLEELYESAQLRMKSNSPPHLQVHFNVQLKVLRCHPAEVF